MAEMNLTNRLNRVGQTDRKDAWWISPLLVFIVLFSFVIYVTWAALQGRHYYFGPYLSPLYSPVLVGDSPHSWFGGGKGWWPWSPAILILWAPGLFRLSCYYYRGAVSIQRNASRSVREFDLLPTPTIRQQIS